METDQSSPDAPATGTATVVLAARLDTAASHALAAELKDFGASDVTVDASQVEHLGAHAAQTLLSAARGWATSGKRFALAPRSAAIEEHLATLGIEPAEFMIGETV